VTHLFYQVLFLASKLTSVGVIKISDLKVRISAALVTADDQKLLELLLKAYEQKHEPIYGVAYGLTQMMPPFEDYDATIEVFTALFGSTEEKLAAIFSGYTYVNLQPFDQGFVSVLEKYSQWPIANYILALYHDH
jgi:hypothetical protein